MRVTTAALLLLVSLALSGCVGAAAEGAHMTKDAAERQYLMPKAQAGDLEAEFKVGESYCCNSGVPAGVYDNQKATEWLCKAARSNYGPAQEKLGRIYSGELVEGARLFRRAGTKIFGPGSDDAYAYMWFSLAAAQGTQDGARLRDNLGRRISPKDRADANTFLQNWRGVPCTWNEVYGS